MSLDILLVWTYSTSNKLNKKKKAQKKSQGSYAITSNEANNKVKHPN